MAARKIGALPNHFASLAIQAGRPVAAEVNIDAPGLEARGGGGVTVDIIAQRLGMLRMKYLFVELNFPGLCIDTNGKEIMPVFGGSC